MEKMLQDSYGCILHPKDVYLEALILGDVMNRIRERIKTADEGLEILFIKSGR
jgi:hypothetical protein